MKFSQVTLVGTTPLVLDNARGADKENPLVLQRNKLLEETKKRGEVTPGQQTTMDFLDFKTSLYLDENDNVVFPALCVFRALQQVSGLVFRKNNRLLTEYGLAVGAPTVKVQTGYEVGDRYPAYRHWAAAVLDHDGPQGDVVGLFKDDDFILRLEVNNDPTNPGKKMVPRTRPVFPRWSLTYRVGRNEAFVSDSALADLLSYAVIGNGRRIGYGQFDFKIEDE